LQKGAFFLNGNSKKSNRGCFSGILGTLLVIIGVVAYAFISSALNRAIIGSKFGDGIAAALLPLSVVGLTVAFILYEIIFIMWQIKLGKPDDVKTSKLFRIVAVACICLSVMFAVVSSNTYTEMREDQIKKVCFVDTATYQWSGERCDVSSYVLSCSSDGLVTYTVVMKDGERVELLGQVNSCSSAFLEKYGNMYAYAAYLTESFENSPFIIDGSLEGEEYLDTFCANNPDAAVSVQKIANYCTYEYEK
jgi:hypothetical protein